MSYVLFVHVTCLIVVLVICHLCFEDRVSVLIAPVPSHSLLFVFALTKQTFITLNKRIILINGPFINFILHRNGYDCNFAIVRSKNLVLDANRPNFNNSINSV